jgi:hypothetical protein
MRFKRRLPARDLLLFVDWRRRGPGWRAAAVRPRRRRRGASNVSCFLGARREIELDRANGSSPDVLGPREESTKARAASLTQARTPSHVPPARRPDDRCCREVMEESPGSTGIRCRLTAGGGDPRDSATENKPPTGWRHQAGKGETVR